jgi:hypothetical protein
MVALEEADLGCAWRELALAPVSNGVDDSISAEERAHVERLVADELASAGARGLHPMVAALSSLARLEVERVEEEEEEEQGVDLARYTEFGDDEVDYDRLSTTLLYAALQRRALEVASEAAPQTVAAGRAHLALAEGAELELQRQVCAKRARIAELEDGRKRRQLAFAPARDRLQERWLDAIKTVMGVENV